MSKKKKNVNEMFHVEQNENEVKYKVEFISSLYSQEWGFRKGQIVELNEEQYQTAKKYNSIKDL